MSSKLTATTQKSKELQEEEQQKRIKQRAKRIADIAMSNSISKTDERIKTSSPPLNPITDETLIKWDKSFYGKNGGKKQRKTKRKQQKTRKTSKTGKNNPKTKQNQQNKQLKKPQDRF